MACRISALWDFSGPALAISAGETGVVRALDIARNLLSSGEADAVVVGAVDLAGGFENLAVRQAIAPLHAEGNPRASFGFDAAQVGWRVGEGAGAIVLKRLADVGAEGAYATLHGLAVRRPLGDESADASIRRNAEAALAQAGVAPHQVGYIEAAARGVRDEDVAEMRGLAAAYGACPERTIAVGSAKALCGHAGVAAGMAGIIRATLAIDQSSLPGTPGWTAPRPEARWDRNVFYVPSGRQPWLTPGGRSVAAVQVADPDGAVAHVVLSSASRVNGDRLPDCIAVPFIVPLAGDDAAGLAARLAQLAGAVHRGVDAEQIEQTVIADMPAQRECSLVACLVAPDARALADEAERMAREIEQTVRSRRSWRSPRGSCVTGAPVGPDGGVAFVYSGMYGAYPGLCRDVLQLVPGMRDELFRRIADPGAAFAEHLLFPRSLKRIDSAAMEAADEKLGTAGEELLRIGVIASLLHTRLVVDRVGVKPNLALGYSLGEVSMMFAAGAWDFQDAWLARISELDPSLRRLMDRAPAANADQQRDGTATFVVAASPEMITAAIAEVPNVHLSLVNSPRECVIVGDAAECERVLAKIAVDSMRLPGRLMFHCPQVIAEQEHLARCFAAPLGDRPAHALMIAGEPVAPWTPDAVGAQIARGLSATLDFPHLVRNAHAAGARLFIEMGPGHACTRWIGDCLSGHPHAAIAVARRGLDETAGMAQLAATLVAHRYPIDLEKVIRRRRPASAAHARTVTLGGTAIAARLSAAMPRTERKVIPIGTRAFADAGAPVDRPPRERSLGSARRNHDLAAGPASVATSQSRGHMAFLRQRLSLVESLSASTGAPDRTTAPASDPAVLSPALYDEADVLEVAEGRVANVFGADFAPIDALPRRVRVPGQPFTAITRVVHIAGTRGDFTSGRIITEFDIPRPAWFAVDGHSASQLSLDAQGVLFLLSWLGVDFENAGRRRFRWLDANVTMLGDLPLEGDTLRYDITLTRSFRDGEALMLYFDMYATSGGRPLLRNQDCCVGFFTDADLATSSGIRPHHRAVRTAARPSFTPRLAPPDRTLGAADLLGLACGDASVLSPAHAISGNPALRLPPPALHMIDSVTAIDPRGGACGLGRIVAEKCLDPTHWAIRAHFKDDAVFPGPCMLEGTVQLLKIFALATGLHGGRQGARFESLCDRSCRLRFREQVLPRGQLFTYRADIIEMGVEPEPYLVADVDFEEGGRVIGRIEEIGLRLAAPSVRSRLRRAP